MERIVFVRNLNFDTNERDLKEFFAKFGPVEYAKVCISKDSGNSKGTGFVKFKKKGIAKKLIEESKT